MQTAVLLVLLGGCVVSVQSGAEDQIQISFSVDQNLQTRVEALERALAQLQNPPRVAFTAALYPVSEEGNYGPFNVATTIKFKNVLTNAGNNYNSATGVFTAPVKGMYFFHFTLFSTYDPPPNLAAALKKNTETLAYVKDEARGDTQDSSSQSVLLALEVGDSVFVELEPNKSIYGYHGHHNRFSGFLLYTM